MSGDLNATGSTPEERLASLGIVDAELPAPPVIEETARPLSAPELVVAEPLP